MAMNEIPEIIMQCVSRDEAALAIAQKVSCKLNLEDFVTNLVYFNLRRPLYEVVIEP